MQIRVALWGWFWCWIMLIFDSMWCIMDNNTWGTIWQVFMPKIWCWIMLIGNAIWCIMDNYIGALFWLVMMPKIGVKLTWRLMTLMHNWKADCARISLGHGNSFCLFPFMHINYISCDEKYLFKIFSKLVIWVEK